jgi:putative two-component system response regulator
MRQLQKRRIMIVDDEETNILTVQAFLQQNGYHEFLSTTDSRDAIRLIRKENPDLVLLDINMPHVSGLDIMRSLGAEASTRHLPVIVLTAASDPDVKKKALELGASDFLTKPVDPHYLIPRVRNSLLIKSHMDEIAGENARLDAMVRRRTEDLSQSRQQLILSLAKAAEHRDDDTGNHVLRVGRYAGVIARALNWPEQRVQMLELAAQLHDVGKIGIPDAILFKPGKLDPQEWELMRKHCSFGKDIIEPISEQDLCKLRTHTRLGADMLHVRSSPMMMMAARIAQTHHERWDGTGYPIGLAGEDIPIEGRITAVADVFDALSSERSYKKAFPRQKCFEIIAEGKGSHFDPTVVDAFFSRSAEIVEVQIALMDRKSK